MSALWKWISAKVFPIFHCIILHFPLSLFSPSHPQTRTSMCVWIGKTFCLCVAFVAPVVPARNKFPCGFVRLQRPELHRLKHRAEAKNISFPSFLLPFYIMNGVPEAQRATNFSSFFHLIPTGCAHRVTQRRVYGEGDDGKWCLGGIWRFSFLFRDDEEGRKQGVKRRLTEDGWRLSLRRRRFWSQRETWEELWLL